MVLVVINNGEGHLHVAWKEGNVVGIIDELEATFLRSVGVAADEFLIRGRDDTMGVCWSLTPCVAAPGDEFELFWDEFSTEVCGVEGHSVIVLLDVFETVEGLTEDVAEG